MIEKMKQIATRIKTLRDISGKSIQQLADSLGIPAREYQEYESGSADISVSTLFEIATYYKVELTALLTGESPRLHHHHVVRAGQGPQVERRSEYQYQDLAYNFSHKKMEAFLVTVQPRSIEKPEQLHHHPGQEFNYVLEGKLKVIMGTNEVILNTGDSLYFDSSQAHAMVALNHQPVRFLAIIS
jgi:quercetin dioxygenase-like cupin family protein